MKTFPQKHFYAVNEKFPAEKWLEHYHAAIPEYRRWFVSEGTLNRITLTECRNALQAYMPEFVPLWEHLLEITQANESDAKLLSFYCPPRFAAGGSQAVWTRYSPVLVRNYDNSPEYCEGRIMKTCWHNTQVIAATASLWGVLDGMNEHGLSASLAFGGKGVVTEGFGIPIILRYVLEFCTTADEAVKVLCRIPSHMAYNITLLDATGQVRTVELEPFSSPVVSFKPLAVNHQGDFALTNYAMFSNSYDRQQFIIRKLYEPMSNVESFLNAFEYSPLFSNNYAQSFGTLYTAIYNPQLRAMEYRWPRRNRMYQSFEVFEECSLSIDFS